MSRPLAALDDGLRNPHRWKHGTNKHFPCGHARVADNTTTYGGCRACRRRMERDLKRAKYVPAAERRA
jgi:hypothetical protein